MAQRYWRGHDGYALLSYSRATASRPVGHHLSGGWRLVSYLQPPRGPSATRAAQLRLGPIRGRGRLQRAGTAQRSGAGGSAPTDSPAGVARAYGRTGAGLPATAPEIRLRARLSIGAGLAWLSDTPRAYGRGGGSEIFIASPPAKFRLKTRSRFRHSRYAILGAFAGTIERMFDSHTCSTGSRESWSIRSGIILGPVLIGISFKSPSWTFSISNIRGGENNF